MRKQNLEYLIQQSNLYINSPQATVANIIYKGYISNCVLGLFF